MTGTTGKAVVTYIVNEKRVGRLLKDLRSNIFSLLLLLPTLKISVIKSSTT